MLLHLRIFRVTGLNCGHPRLEARDLALEQCDARIDRRHSVRRDLTLACDLARPAALACMVSTPLHGPV